MSDFKKAFWDALPRFLLLLVVCFLLLELNRAHRRTDKALDLAEDWKKLAMDAIRTVENATSALEGKEDTSPRYVNAPMPTGVRTNVFGGRVYPQPPLAFLTNSEGKIFITNTNYHAF